MGAACWHKPQWQVLSAVVLAIGASSAAAPQCQTLSQHDQVAAEVNGSLDLHKLQSWIKVTNANTFSFLLWDTDGHGYLDLVRFLADPDAQRTIVDGAPLAVWVTLIPPSESQPARRWDGPPPGCVSCPPSRPHPYGGAGTGGFCCAVPSPDGEHCPGSGECCLSPLPGVTGCEGIRRCGTNPSNNPACSPPPLPPPPPTPPGPPPGRERCSVPADSPLTPFNETAMVDPRLGWRGCNDYAGWAAILGKLAVQYPQLKALNIDDFSSNLATFNPALLAEMRTGLVPGDVKFIPTFYYGWDGCGDSGFVLKLHPWLASATDGALFYFRGNKLGQQQCGTPDKPLSNGSSTCTAPTPETSVNIAGSPVGPAAPHLASQNNQKIHPAPTVGDVSLAPCTSCCLAGTSAELSIKSMPDEVADFASALPAGHQLHIGVYFTHYSHCEQPSVKYDHDVLVAALSNPAVSGATVYITEVPHGPCATTENGAAADVRGPPQPDQDKGCIVQQVFRNFSALHSN